MYPREKLEVDPRLIMARIYLLNKVKWCLLNEMLLIYGYPGTKIVANNTYVNLLILIYTSSMFIKH